MTDITNHFESITLLLVEAGRHRYGGEAVSQLEHALQCAHLAESEGALDTLVTAALLHDLGHLIHDLGDEPAQQGIDDKHEVRALHTLRRVFDDAVLSSRSITTPQDSTAAHSPSGRRTRSSLRHATRGSARWLRSASRQPAMSSGYTSARQCSIVSPMSPGR